MKGRSEILIDRNPEQTKICNTKIYKGVNKNHTIVTGIKLFL